MNSNKLEVSIMALLCLACNCLYFKILFFSNVKFDSAPFDAKVLFYALIVVTNLTFLSLCKDLSKAKCIQN